MRHIQNYNIHVQNNQGCFSRTKNCESARPEVVATAESKCGATARIAFQDTDKQPPCPNDDAGAKCPLVRDGEDGRVRCGS